jgi:hypothetical protein
MPILADRIAPLGGVAVYSFLLFSIAAFERGCPKKGIKGRWQERDLFAVSKFFSFSVRSLFCFYRGLLASHIKLF